MHTPINKDEFIVYYDKVIKLGTAISKSTQLSFATDDHNNNVLVKFSLAKYFRKFINDDALYSNSPIGPFHIFVYWVMLVLVQLALVMLHYLHSALLIISGFILMLNCN
jgi:hypothetical protein